MAAYISKKLTPAEHNYTTNEREVPGLIGALQRFCYYLEGSKWDVLTDNQVVKNFLTKKTINRREARWLGLEWLASYSIWEVFLKPGRIYVLGEALSCVPDVSVGNFQWDAFNVDNLQNLVGDYSNDQIFGPIISALLGILPDSQKEEKKIETLLPYFRLQEWKLL